MTKDEKDRVGLLEKHYVSIVITCIAAILLWAGSQVSQTFIQLAKVEQQLSVLALSVEKLDSRLHASRTLYVTKQELRSTVERYKTEGGLRQDALDLRLKRLEDAHR